MPTPRASDVVRQRLHHAATALRASDPLPFVGDLIDRTFELPAGDERYAFNTLTPGAAPFEPSFSEREPDTLRFTMEPLGPGNSPTTKRDEATREMRKLTGAFFGRDALRWFDRASEDFRGMGTGGDLEYGAWFGSSYDRDGLTSSKVYYELSPNAMRGLQPEVAKLAHVATGSIPGLLPAFATIRCGHHQASERVTFVPVHGLALKDLGPLMKRLGLAHQLPALMRTVGLVLGGRFHLPPNSCLLALAPTPSGPELKLEIMLGAIPDLPLNFLDLVVMGMSERPRHLQALGKWMRAFTPDQAEWPGNFSVLSVKTTPRAAARMSLYLRPVEMEVPRASGAAA